MHGDSLREGGIEPGSDQYQELLAREVEVTYARSWVDREVTSHLLDRTAWRQARRTGPYWWQPVVDPELSWGRELAFVLSEARGRVLELGCGGGWLALELARRGQHVTGLDVCEPLLTAARQYAKSQGFAPPHLEYRVADLNQIALPENSYDTILAWQSLHHLVALPELMQEVRRSLRPGGRLLICETRLDHAERSLQRTLLSLLRKAAKLLLWLLARAGALTGGAPAAPREEEPAACQCDSPFEGVGATRLEAALESQFRPVQVWQSGTWFWEGLPQYAWQTMSTRRWQQGAAVTLLRAFRGVDRLLLRLGARGNYLAGSFEAK